MTPNLKGFSRYLLVGISNTAMHCAVVVLLCLALSAPQSLGNLAGFVVAGSWSFYANALYTFSARLSWSGYLLFMALMGLLNFIVGHVSDVHETPVWVTMIVSSGFGLSVGYCCSRYLVFRRHS